MVQNAIESKAEYHTYKGQQVLQIIHPIADLLVIELRHGLKDRFPSFSTFCLQDRIQKNEYSLCIVIAYRLGSLDRQSRYTAIEYLPQSTSDIVVYTRGWDVHLHGLEEVPQRTDAHSPAVPTKLSNVGLPLLPATATRVSPRGEPGRSRAEDANEY